MYSWSPSPEIVAHPAYDPGGGYGEQTTARINLIGQRLAEILHEAQRADTPPLRLARHRARAILADTRG